MVCNLLNWGNLLKKMLQDLGNFMIQADISRWFTARFSDLISS